MGSNHGRSVSFERKSWLGLGLQECAARGVRPRRYLPVNPQSISFVEKAVYLLSLLNKGRVSTRRAKTRARAADESCANIAATDQAPINTPGVDVHDLGLRTATRSADTAAPRAPRTEMIRPLSTKLPNIRPCERPNASETSTNITSSVTQVRDDGNGMAPAGAEPDTALVPETTEAAPGLAPPPSAQTGSGNRRQLNSSPYERSTPTRRGRQMGVPVEKSTVHSHRRSHDSPLWAGIRIQSHRRPRRTIRRLPSPSESTTGGATTATLDPRGPCRVPVRRAGR